MTVEGRQACPRRTPSVRYRLLDGTGHLVHRNTCLVLDPVAWSIWLRCDGHTPLPAIVEHLAQEFEITDRDQAKADCRVFLLDLVSRGFMSWSGEG